MAGYITETAFTGYLEKLNDTCKTDYVIGLKIVDFPNNLYIYIYKRGYE